MSFLQQYLLKMMTMMIKDKRIIKESAKFQKGLRKAKKQGKNIKLAHKIITMLANITRSSVIMAIAKTDGMALVIDGISNSIRKL